MSSGEFEKIKNIVSLLGKTSPKVLVPAGEDDCAVVARGHGMCDLLTTDLLMEEVHFLRQKISAHDLGHKALAVSLSDIAAMGGQARFALIALALPKDMDDVWLQDFYRGLSQLAEKQRVSVVGGDLSASPGPISITVTVVGKMRVNEVLRRSGAKIGDGLYLSGPVGAAALGRLLYDQNQKNSYLSFTNTPTPQLELGRQLAHSQQVHAAIDVSDGLAQDLSHILAASRCGARVYLSHIPQTTNFEKESLEFELDPWELMLSGGEDYQLLWTASADFKLSSVKDIAPQAALIGVITASAQGLQFVEAHGKVKTVQKMGWDHFKN